MRVSSANGILLAGEGRNRASVTWVLPFYAYLKAYQAWWKLG